MCDSRNMGRCAGPIYASMKRKSGLLSEDFQRTIRHPLCRVFGPGVGQSLVEPT